MSASKRHSKCGGKRLPERRMRQAGFRDHRQDEGFGRPIQLGEDHSTAIDRVANQTSLALNATIEAARAGRLVSFAVVANEVKELSRTTRKINLEIQETIESLQNALTVLASSLQMRRT